MIKIEKLNVSLTKEEFKEKAFGYVEFAVGEKEYAIEDINADFIAEDMVGVIPGVEGDKHGIGQEGLDIIQEVIDYFKQFNGTYLMIWDEDNEKFHYLKEIFNESDFPNGYVDYEVQVKDNIILSDTYNKDNQWKTFSKTYDVTLWNN